MEMLVLLVMLDHKETLGHLVTLALRVLWELLYVLLM